MGVFVVLNADGTIRSVNGRPWCPSQCRDARSRLLDRRGDAVASRLVGAP